MMRPATIFLGQRRRGGGLAGGEEGSGEESARASAFFFGEILAGYKLRKNKIHVSIVVRVKFNAHTYTIILWKASTTKKLGTK